MADAKKRTKVFTDEERDAMVQRAKEVQTDRRRRTGAGEADPEAEVLAKINEMRPADRAMAQRIHALIKASAPDLSPRLWYGMPAYAKGGKVLCHFQDAQKFKTRYATLGFSDEAKLDDGGIWPVAYALKDLSGATEAKIRALLKKAAG